MSCDHSFIQHTTLFQKLMKGFSIACLPLIPVVNDTAGSPILKLESANGGNTINIIFHHKIPSYYSRLFMRFLSMQNSVLLLGINQILNSFHRIEKKS